jgi:secondary thiamine-phosphate synthase enzyme
MDIYSKKLYCETNGNNEVLDLTKELSNILQESGLKEGIAVITVLGSTASLVISENEKGLIKDLQILTERLVPKEKDYNHNYAGENNAHSHLRSSLFGANLALSFEDGRFNLGTWQQILLIDFDNRPRKREIFVKLLGIKS